jgi:hypothetical protein
MIIGILMTKVNTPVAIRDNTILGRRFNGIRKLSFTSLRIEALQIGRRPTIARSCAYSSGSFERFTGRWNPACPIAFKQCSPA